MLMNLSISAIEQVGEFEFESKFVSSVRFDLSGKLLGDSGSRRVVYSIGLSSLTVCTGDVVVSTVGVVGRVVVSGDRSGSYQLHRILTTNAGKLEQKLGAKMKILSPTNFCFFDFKF